jgi:hypothetical protein
MLSTVISLLTLFLIVVKYTYKIYYLKCTSQYYYIHLHCFANTTIIHLKNTFYLAKLNLHLIKYLPIPSFPQPLAINILLSVSMNLTILSILLTKRNSASGSHL